MDIVLSTKKANMYDEVVKPTGYVGAKVIEDTRKAYDRAFTTDDDRLMLEGFRREAVGAATDEIKRSITNVSTQANAQTVDINEVWTVNLEMPSNFDDNLIDSINDSLFSYAVNSIVSKWSATTNKEEANMYSGMAVSCSSEAESKLYYRKEPKRVVPSI